MQRLQKHPQYNSLHRRANDSFARRQYALVEIHCSRRSKYLELHIIIEVKKKKHQHCIASALESQLRTNPSFASTLSVSLTAHSPLRSLNFYSQGIKFQNICYVANKGFAILPRPLSIPSYN